MTVPMAWVPEGGNDGPQLHRLGREQKNSPHRMPLFRRNHEGANSWHRNHRAFLSQSNHSWIGSVSATWNIGSANARQVILSECLNSFCPTSWSMRDGHRVCPRHASEAPCLEASK